MFIFSLHVEIYFLQIAQKVCFSVKVTSCAGQIPPNPSGNIHSIMAIFSTISHICEIANRKLKYACCTRHIYLFLLFTQGHCFHGDSLMASFAFLFLINFFTPLPSYQQYLCLKTAHDHCGSGSLTPHPVFFTLYPYLPYP